MNGLMNSRSLRAVRLASNVKTPCSRRHAFSPGPDQTGSDASRKARSRLQRVTSRLPKFLQRYTTPLIDAPLTHVSAFLLLHELTAIVPMFGLTAAFHYYQWTPTGIREDSPGVEKIRTYLRKKGLVGPEDNDGAEHQSVSGGGDVDTQLILQAATSYAIVKMLLPVRLILSVWATPWFARFAVVSSMNLFRRLTPWRRRP